jgi:glutamate synthase domain-containing protein 1
MIASTLRREVSGCSLFGCIHEGGRRFSGELAIRAISAMRERANGLGGGFAGYGIYPEHAREYALHLMYDSEEAKRVAEEYFAQHLTLSASEPLPTRPVPEVSKGPLLWRYFGALRPADDGEARDEDDRMLSLVMHVNASLPGAFVVSSGKNMGIFKGVGFPEDIGRFYRLEEYDGWSWTAHGRFPTNSVAWWGGAHPFGVLDWSVVHNGEISSYGINKRYLENFGYRVALSTDTEVLSYLFDLLVRRHGLGFEEAALVLAAPLWTQIERMPEPRRSLARTLRIVYSSALVNGPFAIVVGHGGGLVALNDRVKLRPLVVGRAGEMTYISSEESAMHSVASQLEDIWAPHGGEPVIVHLKQEVRASTGSAPGARQSRAQQVEGREGVPCPSL